MPVHCVTRALLDSRRWAAAKNLSPAFARLGPHVGLMAGLDERG